MMNHDEHGNTPTQAHLNQAQHKTKTCITGSMESSGRNCDPSANTSAPTFKHGADLPHSETAQAGKLAEGQLEEEERNAAEHQHDEVRQHEGTWVERGGSRTATQSGQKTF